ncbi:isopentenyl-diphosphate Delta-isomerase [Pseudonocardia acidicola]|uniref:Isopentenyl-diphosphate Delta-isomerase n=1 Tax=Pseudonocardia acidicola TaxID=2724939 RepID=A0ABX1SDN3_9PSEU|nr:isopentenyl-diphosphate Delta-isomerase [Pseudonocardia acidicola]NMH99683.1 isopentenyl-diphosphate Delta-isomerase [Pseudonocardia acidicola]
MEQVVLLTESGHALGVLDKAAVHHRDTPLHLAFSCYVFDSRGRLLITQRARGKKTWPGVWTNSCCGHPGPGESLTDSVRRRLRQELRIQPTEITLILPRFRYRAVMPNGIAENEMCPVFRAYTESEPRPDSSEVDGFDWVDWSDLADQVRNGRRDVSPWCIEQVTELISLGPDPRQWSPGDVDALPPAARAVEIR